MNSRPIRIAAGGVQDAMKGSEYQHSLIQLFSIKAFNKSVDFECWTEDGNAGKFDDLIFSCVEDGKTSYTFLQAKQKATIVRLDYFSFFKDKNYQLHKYFESFVEIERNFSINYSDIDLSSLIIATNNRFVKPIRGILKLSNPNSNFKSKCLTFEVVKDQEIFGKMGKIYRFSRAHETANLKCVKDMFLATELFQLLFQKPQKWFLLGYCKRFLCSEVFDVTEISISLKADFLNPNPNFDNFSNFFKYVVDNSLSDDSKNSQKAKDFYKRTYLNPDLLEILETFTDDERFVDEKVLSFIRKYEIVSDLVESEIQNHIKIGILREINVFDSLGFATLMFQDSIKNWLITLSQKTTSKAVNSRMISEIFQSKMDQNRLTQENLIFTKFEPGLIDFMNSNLTSLKDRILIYEVPKDESFWNVQKIHNLDKFIFFLDSQNLENLFEYALKILQSSTESHCLVIGCHKNFNKTFTKFWGQLVNVLKQKSNLKVIAIFEEKCLGNFPEYKKICDKPSICGDLTEDSLNSQLEKSVKFQGDSVKLCELFGGAFWRSVPLKDVQNFTEMGDRLQKADIYLHRSVYRKNCLDKKILEDFDAKVFQDRLCFDENEFKTISKFSSTDVPVHLVEKVFLQEKKDRNGQTPATHFTHLIWKKSHKSIENLRNYSIKEKAENKTDDDFLTSSNEQICVVSGQAGMGKSSFFHNLAIEMKNKFPNYWIQKIDLQVYYDELQVLENRFQKLQVHRDDNEQIQKFFYDEIMKFSCPLQLEIFKNLMKDGRVIVLFDGFDEICEIYKDTVISLVNVLLKPSPKNKFFISTRPEWTEVLENHFSQFSFFFHPFTEDNQIEFLKKFWKKGDDCTALIKSFLQTLNKKISDKQRSYFEIPLITRLIGEYFKDMIDNDELIKDSDYWDSQKFSSLDLIEQFVEKSFEICLEKQFHTKKSHWTYPKERENLEDIHKKLAFKILFPKEFTKIFPKFTDFDEESKTKLIKCGLVIYVSGKLKFCHQSTAEYLVIKFIKEGFAEKHIFKFVFRVILIDSSCQLIRSLLNEFISELITDQNKDEVREFVLKNIEILFLAARESNLETFNALFDVLLEQKGRFLTIQSIKMKNLLTLKDKFGLTLPYNLFAYCENPIDVLEKLKNAFGIKFVKEILQSESGSNKLKVTTAAARHGRNYTPFLTWIYRNFSEQPDFIKSISMSKDQLKEDALHLAVYNFKEESFFALLTELKCLEKFTQDNFLSELILHRNYEDETFMCKLIDLIDAKTEEQSFDIVMKIFIWIGSNSNCLGELLFRKSQSTDCSLIFYATRRFNKKPFELIKMLQKSTNRCDFLLYTTEEGDTFLNEIFHGNLSDDPKLLILEILQWMKEVDSNLLKKIVSNRNRMGQNFVHQFFLIFDTEILPELIKSTVIWLQDNFIDFNAAEFLKLDDGSDRKIFKMIAESCLSVDEAFSTEFKWIPKTIHQWIFENFPDDAEYVSEICLTQNHFKFDVFHLNCTAEFNVDSFMNFLTEMKYLEKYFDDGLLGKQILFKNDRGEVFIKPLTEILLKVKSEEEAVAILKEIVTWIAENTEILYELLSEKDENNENSIFHLSKALNSNLVEVLRFFESSLNATEIFLHTNSEGNAFLPYVAYEERLIDVMSWLKDINSNLLEKLAENRNVRGQNFFQQICACTENKYMIPKRIKMISEWIEANIPNFSSAENLLNRDLDRRTILSYVFCENSSEPLKPLIELMSFLKSFGSDLLTIEKIKDENLIHQLYRPNAPLLNIIQELFDFLKLNFPNFNQIEFLLHKDSDGNTFLPLLIDSPVEFSKVINWLNDIDTFLVDSFIQSQNDFGENFIHQICRILNERFVPILKIFVEWVESNVPNTNPADILLQTNIEGDTFLPLMLSKSDHTIAPLLNLLGWMNEIDLTMINKLIRMQNKLGENLAHQICRFCSSKENIPDVLKEVFYWLEANNSNFVRSEFLLHRNLKGESFLNHFNLHDENNEVSKQSIIKLLDWIGSIDLNLIIQLFDSPLSSIPAIEFWLDSNESFKVQLDLILKRKFFDGKVRLSRIAHEILVLDENPRNELIETLNLLRDEIYTFNLLHFFDFAKFVEHVTFTERHFQIDVLHQIVTSNFRKNSFIKLLNELKCLDNFFNFRFLTNRLLNLDGLNRTFLQNLAIHFYKTGAKSRNFEIVSEILIWTSKNSNCFDELVDSKNSYHDTIVFDLIRTFPSHTLELLKLLKSLTNSSKFLLEVNWNRKNFLMQILYFTKDDELISIYEIVRWLNGSFGSIFDEIIHAKDKREIDFLTEFTNRHNSIEIPDDIKEILQLLV